MSIIRIAIGRPVTVFMFFVAVILFGWVSLDRLALNLLPEISYPSLTIQTDYEDAAPEEIESLVTRPIEEAVGIVSGLNRISSVSRPGQSEVLLEFGWDADMDMASMDVREKLDVLVFPQDVEKPVILRFDPSNDPILRLQLYSDMSLARLRDVAERELKKRLEAVEGVAAVRISGGREEQIRIEIDEKRLAELGIPITEVTNVLRQENINQASGSLYDLDANYLVRMLNEFRTVEEIRRIIIRDQQGRRIILGDIAEVWRGAKDRGVIARFDGKESVEAAIFKEGDANTVTVARAVQDRLMALRQEKTFPKDVNWEIVFNQADFISESVDNVLSAAVVGGALAVIILFVFLRDLRSTVIIGVSIPVSIMATFALMYQTGITLNIMSLGGVALGVGMLVDNSIVVLEAVHRYRDMGGSLADRVARGATEVGGAVTASTLTTLAVFLPMIFVEGVAGQLFTDQALTIVYSLSASLLVALTFIPMALALELRPDSEPQGFAAAPIEAKPGILGGIGAAARRLIRFLFVDVVRTVVADVRRGLALAGRMLTWALNPLLTMFDRGYGRVEGTYPRLLRRALDHKTSVVFWTTASAVLAVLMAAGIGSELIPSFSQGEFSFEIRLPEGAPLEQTNALLQEVEEKARETAGVKTVFSSVGVAEDGALSSNASVDENVGKISVVMENKLDREAELAAVASIREGLASRPDVAYVFERPTFFSFKAPIEVEIFAYDLDDQRRAAEMVSNRLAGIEGLRDIQSSAKLGAPEVQIRFDRARLARLNLEENQIAQLLRNKIRGDVASRYRDEGRQIDILVRAEESDRDAVADLRDLVVNSPRANNSQNAQGQTGQRQNRGGGQAQNSPGASAMAQGQGQSQGQGQQGQNPVNAISIRLGQVADITIARGPSEIRRIRSQRAAVLTANLVGRDLGSASADIDQALVDLRPDLPSELTADLGGQNEELQTSYNSLVFALTLAIFLVYLVMASQFESLVHPFVILFSVPLGVVGVVYALFLTGTIVSVVVLLGVIILAGIVVNNAIVLIDYANQLRREGLSTREALVQAGQVRLRPIMMTTLTTVLGLAPMALGWGEGSEIRTPMAIAVIGGLSFSTLLTLVLIPVAYEWITGGPHRVTAVEPSAAGGQAVEGAD